MLLDLTGRVHGRHPDRMKRYFVNDEFHTIMLGAGIDPGEELGRAYRSLRIGDALLRDWVYDFVNQGPRWQDIVELPTPTPFR